MLTEASDINIFKVAKVEDYHCNILNYSLGHRNMYIEVKSVSNRRELFYLVFGRVLYFEGLTSWRGVNVRLAPKQEYLALLRRIKALDELTDETLLSAETGYQLFVFAEPASTVKIVARFAQKSADLPVSMEDAVSE